VDFFAQAVGIIVQPGNLILLIGSVFMGIAVGAAPGLTPTMAIGLLVPLTFAMSSHAAFIMMLGIYCGGIYGGSITAILLNLPGTPTAAVTAIEGYPMTQKGESGTALGVATVCSTLGGLISCIFLIFLSPNLASVATMLGGPEYFCLALFATVTVVALTGASIVKSLIATCLGLLISTIGLDRVGSFPRFTFGVNELLIGIPASPAIIGLLCVSEVFRLAEQSDISVKIKKSTATFMATIKLLPKLWKTIIKSSLIGTYIGILPATGALMASFLAYGEAKRSSKHPEEFGKGAVEGVCASETANNAVTGGAMIPLLTLGIPGDTNTLMMMGAMFVQGLIPGPTLFREQTVLIYVIYIAMILSNLLIMPFGLFMSNQIAKVALIKKRYIMSAVAVLAIAGGSIGMGHIYYFWITITFGILGYIFEKSGFPVIALGMAIILGPLMEANLRSSLMDPEFGFLMFFTRPIALIFMVLSVLMVIYGIRRQSNSKA
jgi:putative tricarboxylic transport membrane protein